MKAIRIKEFGGAEVMNLEEAERPVPKPDEILLKVYASGVNAADWAIRKGGNDFLRPMLKLPMILGWDAAGIVEEIGVEVKNLKKGDIVYGVPNFPGDGSYAEYCVGKASRFALKPKSVSFNEAASVPLAGLTAWTGIVIHGKVQAGQRVLIHGASGGVGSFAVQFAKAKGAFVIGLTSTDNISYVKQLGADEVVDYKKQKFEDVVKNVDFAFDGAPGGDTDRYMRTLKVMKDAGTLISVNLNSPMSEEVKKACADKKVRVEVIGMQATQEALDEIAGLIDNGKVKINISKVYPLAQVAEAHRESETWHVRGKLVLEVVKEN